MQGNPLERMVVESVEQQRSRLYGKYRGTVSDITDPEDMGRIKALVPEVLGDKETPWALPCMPYAGNGVGTYHIPPKGTGVWIEFEAGDPARPIWTGCRWGKNELPKNEESAATKPPIKVIRTESGMMVTMNDDKQELSVSDKDGNNILKIEANSGTVTIKGAIKAIVEAPLIELVENATHPVVFGDELVKYLNQVVQTYATHMHVGETCLGIPCTPIVPAQPMMPPMPTLLSKIVKAG